MDNRPNQSLAMPLAIIVAGFMVASAIYVSNSQTGFLKADKSNGVGVANDQKPGTVAGAEAQPTNPAVVPDTAEPEQESGQNSDGTYTVSVDDDPVLGQDNAPVTMILFSDFRCPFCGRFATEAMAEIEKNYIETGKVKLVFRDLSIHPPQSDDAASAAQCAGEQGKFWDYHDLLYSKLTAGDEFTVTNLKSYAGLLGLNQSNFNACLDGGKYKTDLDEDYAAARAVSATGTPTLFIGKSSPSGEINAVKVVGAQPFETFEKEIENQLQK